MNGSLASNKKYKIQITYGNTHGNTKYHTLCLTIHHTPCLTIPHTPCPKTQAKTWQLMHNKYTLNTFTVLQYFGENGRFYYKQGSSFEQSYKRFLHRSFLIQYPAFLCPDRLLCCKFRHESAARHSLDSNKDK